MRGIVQDRQRSECLSHATPLGGSFRIWRVGVELLDHGILTLSEASLTQDQKDSVRIIQFSPETL